MSQKTLLAILAFCLIFPSALFSDEPAQRPPLLSFENSGLPGFTGGVLYLFDSQQLYAGGTVRFDFFYSLDRSRKNSTPLDRGRSEVYIAVGFYAAVPPRADGVDMLFNYVFGFNVAFETPAVLGREFLIPYIGLELGGIYIQNRGNGFMACPLIGINIVSLPTFTVSLETGVLLCTIAFEEFLSLRPQLILNFVL